MRTQTVIQKKKASARQEKTKTCLSLIDKTIEKLAEQLEQGYSDAMKKYLKAMSMFHQYSINNFFLIMAQKPDAKRIAGFRTWKKLNRQVKKGEKGIRIFAPVILKKKKKDNEEHEEQVGLEEEHDLIINYRTVCVFDQSQTDGDPLPEPTEAKGDASKLIPELEQAITTSGIELEYGDTGPALGRSCKGKIVIKHGMSSAETFSTLAHEFAHELLHQTGEPKESRSIRELEADAVACVVCEYFGINAIESNADYIKLWDGDKYKLMDRMSLIRECSSNIIEKINEQIQSFRAFDNMPTCPA